MNDSIFTKIIKGEIPSHKIYEDDFTYAFLDINPVQPGHTLVVPKVQVDHIWDLDSNNYQAIWAAAQKIAAHLKSKLGKQRIGVKVEGFDVPHAHIHLIPANNATEFNTSATSQSEPDHKALADMAAKLAF